MALVAGLIYTYATAVMPNLADADDRTFVSVMQRDMDNPVFVATFGVALVLMVVAVVAQRRHGPAPAARWTTAALALYGVAVAVTMVIHVPLNDAIVAEGDPDLIADLAQVRNDFEGPWVAWNVVRAVFAIAAVAALARGIHRYPRSISNPGTAANPAAPSHASTAR